MFRSRRLPALLLLAAAGYSLTGCGGDSSDRAALGRGEPGGSQRVYARFSPDDRVLPLPTDLALASRHDDASSAAGPRERYSTAAHWRTTFSGPVRPAGPGAVRLFQLLTESADDPLQPLGVVRELVRGDDFELATGPNHDVLIVLPLQPLAEDSFYLTVITRKLVDLQGYPVRVGLPRQCERYRRPLDTQLRAVEAAGLIQREQVVFSWSLRTQTVGPAPHDRPQPTGMAAAPPPPRRPPVSAGSAAPASAAVAPAPAAD